MTEAPGGRYAWLVAIGVFAFSLPMLIYHAAPGISFHDSGEFALAAASFGVTHPPGAPTWTLLAAPFARLFAFTDFARAANCFSATMGAASLAFLFLLAWYALPHSSSNSPKWRTAACLTAPLFLLHSEAFLEQSFVAEQYTLLLALMLLVLVLVVRTIHAGSSLLALAAGIVSGLAIGNHPSQVCLLPGILMMLAAVRVYHAWRSAIRAAAASATGIVIGLQVYLYLPLAAARRPLLDAVSATSRERFIAAVTRKSYEPRALAEVPSNFVSELLMTYDFIGELGFLGFVFALLGIVAFVRHRSVTFAISLLVIAGYGAGMFYGFIRQRFDEFYLLLYGIRDWHLPLYAGGALLGASGVNWLFARPEWQKSSSLKAGFVSLVLLAGSVTASMQISRSSLREFSAPNRFLHDMWRALPADSIVLTNTDNATMMLSYYSCRTGAAVESQRVVHGELGDIAACMKSRGQDGWSSVTRLSCLRALTNVDSQPLNLPPLTEDRVLSAPVFADHQGAMEGLGDHLVPAGFLFRLSEDAVTSEQIVRAELEWRSFAPDMYVGPNENTKVHRLEREARGTAFWQRAGYFYRRELWLLAKEDYQRALQWTPNNGLCWYGLGLCFERTGEGKARAIAAYDEALRWQPWLDGPKKRLAALRSMPD